MLSKTDKAIIQCVDSGWITVDTENGLIYNKRGRNVGTIPQVNGYSTVNLRCDVGYTTAYVHRVVAYAYYGIEALEADVIDHEDRNRYNNRIDNLVPKTYAENNRNKDKSAKGIIDKETAYEIAKLRTIGLSYEKIGSIVSTSYNTVRDAVLKHGAYKNYDTPEPEKWKDFWEDVDKGETNKYLHEKYKLRYDTINRRIARRKG